MRAFFNSVYYYASDVRPAAYLVPWGYDKALLPSKALKCFRIPSIWKIGRKDKKVLGVSGPQECLGKQGPWDFQPRAPLGRERLVTSSDSCARTRGSSSRAQTLPNMPLKYWYLPLAQDPFSLSSCPPWVLSHAHPAFPELQPHVSHVCQPPPLCISQ